jgi:hypothetical protein
MDTGAQVGVNSGIGGPSADARPSLEQGMNRLIRALACLAVTLLPAVAAQAASLPVQVSVGTNSATVRIGSVQSPLADLSLRFDQATGLSAANLGITAETVSLSDPALLARLPAQASLQSALPVLVTIEPPVGGSLVQKRVTHVELHTHALAYVAGSRLRLFKAQLGGPFRDITNAIEPGSVRTRGTTPGWSQFLVLLDLRPTGNVIAEKFAYLHAEVNKLPATEANPLRAFVVSAEAAVADGRFDDAVVAMDSFKARVSARAGTAIPDTWRAKRDLYNHAGELMAGANTLVFSIGFLRDFGV